MTNEKDENVNSINNWSGISSVSLPSTFINVCGQNNSMPLINNNKINKLKNIIQVYTNTETMINNKLAVEWLAKSYVDLLTKLNNEEISLKEFEIQYIELLEQAKEMQKQMTIKLYADYENYLEEAFKNQCGGQAVILSFQEFYEQTYGGGEQ
jgi:hypothetical protein